MKPNRFFKGLFIGIPLYLLMWGIIAYIVWAVSVSSVTINSENGLNSTNTTFNISHSCTDCGNGNFSFWTSPNNGVILAYSFDANTTPIYDLTNNENNATIVGSGSSLSWKSGLINFSNPSATGYINITGKTFNNTFNGNNFTICLSQIEFNNGSQANRYIFGKWDSGASKRSVGISKAEGSGLRFQTSDTGSTVSGNQVNWNGAQYNVWYRNCFVYETTYNYIYANGSLVASVDRSTDGVFASSVQPIIGAILNSGAGSSGWNGSIDSIIIYNYSLSQINIQEDYTSWLNNRNIKLINGTDNTTYTANVCSANATDYSCLSASVFINGTQILIPSQYNNISVNVIADGGNQSLSTLTTTNTTITINLANDPFGTKGNFFINASGLLNKNVTFIVEDPAGGTSIYNGTYKPVYKCTNETNWRYFDSSIFTSSTLYNATNYFTCNASEIAHLFPMTVQGNLNFVTGYSLMTGFNYTTIGTSLQGRNVSVLSLTNVSINDSFKKHIIIVTNQHPVETFGPYIVRGIIDKILNSTNTSFLLNHYHFYIFTQPNPDGVFQGYTRPSSDGTDLNRDWVVNASPEIRAIKNYALAINASYNISMFFDFHGYDDNGMSSDGRRPLSAEMGASRYALAGAFFSNVTAVTSKWDLAAATGSFNTSRIFFNDNTNALSFLFEPSLENQTLWNSTESLIAEGRLFTTAIINFYGDFNLTSSDTTPPTLTIQSPLNNSVQATKNTSLNFTVFSSVGLDKCWYVNATGQIINLINCSNTTFNGIEGLNNITVYVNDTSNNINSSKVFFTINTLINLTNFTVTTGFNYASIYFNSSSLNSLSNVTILYGKNLLSLTYVLNTLLNEGTITLDSIDYGATYNFNISFYDSMNNHNEYGSYTFLTKTPIEGGSSNGGTSSCLAGYIRNSTSNLCYNNQTPPPQVTIVSTPPTIKSVVADIVKKIITPVNDSVINCPSDKHLVGRNCIANQVVTTPPEYEVKTSFNLYEWAMSLTRVQFILLILLSTIVTLTTIVLVFKGVIFVINDILDKKK